MATASSASSNSRQPENAAPATERFSQAAHARVDDASERAAAVEKSARAMADKAADKAADAD
jgi:hypothetical protein